jgi:hypothetical protein
VEQGSFEGEFYSSSLDVTLSIMNTGRTQARIVAFIIERFIGARPPAPLSDDGLLLNNIEGFVIPPQGPCSYPFFVTSAPTVEQVEAIRQGKEVMYIHGRFLYRDGFRELPHAPYEAPFLLRYDVRRRKFYVTGYNARKE